MKKLALAVLVTGMICGSAYAQGQKAEIGGKFVDFEVCDTEGGYTYISDYVGGTTGEKYLMLYFWTCPACIKGVGDVVKVTQRYKDRLDVVAVNLSNDPNRWAEMYAKANPFPWANLSDGRILSEGARQVYPIPRFPTGVLLDRDGKIVDMWSSSNMESAEGFAEKVKPYLGEPE